VSGPKTLAALERAGLAPASTETSELIQFGLGRIGASDDEVLEITRAFWQTDTHGGNSVAILTRETLCVVVAPITTGMLLRRKSAPACAQIPLTTIEDLIDDDKEMGGAVIFFFAEPNFLLRFEHSAERDRFFPCIFEAQRGLFSRWGLQLDPANYAADFARFHAELSASGVDDSIKLLDWIESRYGDFPINNALAWHGSGGCTSSTTSPTPTVRRPVSCGSVPHPCGAKSPRAIGFSSALVSSSSTPGCSGRLTTSGATRPTNRCAPSMPARPGCSRR
jgi:hypothetical protein